MRRSEVLLHGRVEAELVEFRRQHRKNVGALEACVRRLFADPHRAGAPLQGVTQADLQGRLRKIHVGGRRGHRLFFWVPVPRTESSPRLVIPLWLPRVQRTGLRYDSISMNLIGQDIVDDYRASRYDQFRRFLTPDVLLQFLEQSGSC